MLGYKTWGIDIITPYITKNSDLNLIEELFLDININRLMMIGVRSYIICNSNQKYFVLDDNDISLAYFDLNPLRKLSVINFQNICSNTMIRSVVDSSHICFGV